MRTIRDLYDEYGVADYYRLHGSEYRNPHADLVREATITAVRSWWWTSRDLRSVLDLACGSGEVTKTLQALKVEDISGVDPYTYSSYKQRTGLDALQVSFDDIIQRGLPRRYNCIFCSYALHLLEPSKLPRLIWELSLISQKLVIITPHKRPIIKLDWGYMYMDEFKYKGARVRCYSRIPIYNFNKVFRALS